MRSHSLKCQRSVLSHFFLSFGLKSLVFNLSLSLPLSLCYLSFLFFQVSGACWSACLGYESWAERLAAGRHPSPGGAQPVRPPVQRGAGGTQGQGASGGRVKNLCVFFVVFFVPSSPPPPTSSPHQRAAGNNKGRRHRRLQTMSPAHHIPLTLCHGDMRPCDDVKTPEIKPPLWCLSSEAAAAAAEGEEAVAERVATVAGVSWV